MNLIVAVSENGVIGKDNQLPWRQKEDLRRFKKITLGSNIVMGRKTFESLPVPLTGRVNIVLTRDESYEPSCEGFGPDDVAPIACNDFQEVYFWNQVFKEKTFVIGGAQVYEQALPLVDRIYLTKVHTELEGDAFFHPDGEWEVVSREFYPKDEENEHDVTFYVLERL